MLLYDGFLTVSQEGSLIKPIGKSLPALLFSLRSFLDSRPTTAKQKSFITKVVLFLCTAWLFAGLTWNKPQMPTNKGTIIYLLLPLLRDLTEQDLSIQSLQQRRKNCLFLCSAQRQHRVQMDFTSSAPSADAEGLQCHSCFFLCVFWVGVAVSVMEMHLLSLRDLYSPTQNSMNLVTLSASWGVLTRDTKKELLHIKSMKQETEYLCKQHHSMSFITFLSI